MSKSKTCPIWSSVDTGTGPHPDGYIFLLIRYHIFPGRNQVSGLAMAQ